MSRSITRIIAIAVATGALAAAPGAMARPADQGVRLAPATSQQLPAPAVVPSRVGPSAQLPDPAFVASRAPSASAPVQATPDGGSTSPVPWIAGGVALLLFTAYGVFRYTGTRPARRRQPAA
jgi:hypothetical protein